MPDDGSDLAETTCSDFPPIVASGKTIVGEIGAATNSP